MQTLILNHYPPVIKGIKEMQQIAKAEDIEFSKLHAAIDGVLRNMFIYTAEETGVARFENMIGIIPKEGQRLDERKAYIAFATNRKQMSLSELTAMLSSYCRDISLARDTKNMEITVEMSAGEVGTETIDRILEEVLPLNICYSYKIKVGAEKARIKMIALQRMGGTLHVERLH